MSDGLTEHALRESVRTCGTYPAHGGGGDGVWPLIASVHMLVGVGRVEYTRHSIAADVAPTLPSFQTERRKRCVGAVVPLAIVQLAIVQLELCVHVMRHEAGSRNDCRRSRNSTSTAFCSTRIRYIYIYKTKRVCLLAGLKGEVLRLRRRDVDGVGAGHRQSS